MQITVAENYWDDDRLSRVVPFKGAGHFFGVAILRRSEASADQQENDLGFIQRSVNLIVPVLPRNKLTIVPVGDVTLVFQLAKVIIELLSKNFVRMRIRDEYFNWGMPWRCPSIDGRWRGNDILWHLLNTDDLVIDQLIGLFRKQVTSQGAGWEAIRFLLEVICILPNTRKLSSALETATLSKLTS